MKRSYDDVHHRHVDITDAQSGVVVSKRYLSMRRICFRTRITPCLNQSSFLCLSTMLVITMPKMKAHANPTMKVAATIEQQCLSLSRRCRAASCTSHCSQCTCGFGLNTPARVCTSDSGAFAGADAGLGAWSWPWA
jgi:hypothetical protein